MFVPMTVCLHINATFFAKLAKMFLLTKTVNEEVQDSIRQLSHNFRLYLRLREAESWSCLMESCTCRRSGTLQVNYGEGHLSH